MNAKQKKKETVTRKRFVTALMGFGVRRTLAMQALTDATAYGFTSISARNNSTGNKLVIIAANMDAEKFYVVQYAGTHQATSSLVGKIEYFDRATGRKLQSFIYDDPWAFAQDVLESEQIEEREGKKAKILVYWQESAPPVSPCIGALVDPHNFDLIFTKAPARAAMYAAEAILRG